MLEVRCVVRLPSRLIFLRCYAPETGASVASVELLVALREAWSSVKPARMAAIQGFVREAVLFSSWSRAS